MTANILSFGLPFIEFALGFVAIFILPGWLIFNLLFERKHFDFFEIFPLSFSFSLTLSCTLAILLYFAGLNTTALIILLPAVILLLIIVNVLKWRTLKSTQPPGSRITNHTGDDSRFYGIRSRSLIYIILLLASVLMLYKGATSHYLSDSADHVGTIREIMEKRQIFPTNSFYAGEEGLGPDPRKGLYHISIAVLAIITKVEPFQIWLWLPIFLLPLWLCSFLTFTRELFKDKYIALISFILFFLCFRGLATAGYSSNVAFQIYFIALYFAFKYIRSTERKYLFCSAVLAYTTATIHIFFFVHFGLSLLVFLVFSLLFRRDHKMLTANLVKIGVLTLLISAPFLILKYKLTYSISNPVDLQPRHLLYLSEHLSIVSPWSPIHFVGPLGVLALLLTPFLYRDARKHDGILLLFGSMLIIPLILFNPYVVSFFSNILTPGLVRRMIRWFPHIAVVGFFTHKMIWSLRFAQEKRKTIIPLAFLFLMLVIILFSYVPAGYRYYSVSNRSRERALSPLVWKDAFTFMESKIPDPSVVLSDPITSYCIPAFTKHYIVAIPFGHSSPKDPGNVEKVRGARDVLNPYVNLDHTLAILNRYNVGYVVLNQSFRSPIVRNGWSIDPDLYEETRQKFASRPQLFQEIYNDHGIHIYEYHAPTDAAGMQATNSAPLPFVMEKMPAIENPADAVFEDQFMLLGTSLYQDTVRCGGSLRIRSLWKRLEERDFPDYYMVIVDFTTDYPKNMLYSRHYEKIYRHVLQKISGRQYRFRSRHNPVNGFYPPDLWEFGEIVLDDFEVNIPSDAAAGSYDVKLKLLKVEYFNYHISHYFSDNDMYSGVRIGSIVIER
jgi:hypothetical protein